MKPIFRPYQTEDDFWRMREFLRQVFLMNGCFARSWHVARLDYARWHSLINCAKLGLEDVAFLWENDDQIVAILMPDGGFGEAHFLMHPGLRTLELEGEMLGVAEAHLTSIKSDGSKKLCIWAPEPDQLRQELFAQHGYLKGDQPEYQWRRRLDIPIPDVSVYPGYQIRALGDGLELLERCYASGLGFHEGDIQVAIENRNDPNWYRNIQRAPLYRRDLDLVAIAPDGSIAGFCTIWFDDVTRSAYFEPVAVVPAHRQRGLGKSIMTAGLCKLQHMGAETSLVCGYAPAANALYQSVMGPRYDLYEPWTKDWLP